jgi:hypothetical protein
MARVQVSSQAWGYVMDSRGRPRTDGLCAINTTVYEASTGETPISTVDFRTDAEGLLPGWVEQGTHTFTEPDGDTRQVEAARGDTAASGDVPAHNADFTDVHGITDTRRIAVREEAPVVATAPEFGTLLGDDSVGSHTANTTALSAAIDRAAAAVNGGGSLYIPSGLYRYSNLAKTLDDITIFGDGPGKTILKTMRTHGGGQTQAINLAGNYLTVRDLELREGNPIATKTGRTEFENGEMLRIGGVWATTWKDRTHVENLLIDGGYTGALNIQHVDHAFAQNIRIKNAFGDGMNFENCREEVYANNIMIDDTTDDLFIIKTDATVKSATASLTTPFGAEATNILTSAGHDLRDGDGIMFATLTGGAGLATATRYWVMNATANTFQVMTTPESGVAVNFTTNVTAGTYNKLGGTKRVNVSDLILRKGNAKGFTVIGGEFVNANNVVIEDTHAAGAAVIYDFGYPNLSNGHRVHLTNFHVLRPGKWFSADPNTHLYAAAGTAGYGLHVHNANGVKTRNFTVYDGQVRGYSVDGYCDDLDLDVDVQRTAHQGGVVGDPDGTTYTKVQNSRIRHKSANTVAGLVIGSCENIKVENPQIRSYKSGGAGSNRGLQIGFARDLEVTSPHIVNDDGGEELVLVYNSPDHVRIERGVQKDGSTYQWEGSATWDIASIADGAADRKTGISCPGARAGDRVECAYSANLAAGAMFTAQVTGDDTVAVTVLNKTGGVLDPGPNTIRVWIPEKVY